MSDREFKIENIEDIIALLAEKLELGDREIADILWLALKRQEFASEEGSTAERKRPVAMEERKETEGETARDEAKRERTEDGRRNFPDAPPTPKAPVYTASSVSREGGVPIAIPDAPSLREPIAFARSLRPLMRRVSGGRRMILDEIATVDRVAREAVGKKRTCIPVLKAEPESWLDLALVIDESPSMLIWQHAVRDLERLLKNYGIFRDLRIWGIAADKEEKKLRMFSRSGSNWRSVAPEEIVDPTGRRLILVVSDCVSPLWRKGIIFPTLHAWMQKQPLATIQMLPGWMWRRSALGLGTAVKLSSSVVGTPNRDLLVNKKFFTEKRTKIPILTLDPEQTVQWSQMLVGKADAIVPGYLLPDRLNIAEHPLLARQQQAIAHLDATQRLDRFRKNTSLLGRKLASLLAAAPVITLPVVRLIRESLLPASRQVQVAEVFLGGLLQPKSEIVINGNTEADAIKYEFIKPEIRDLFLDGAPVKDSTDVLNAVSRYVAEQMGKSLDEFMALLKMPETEAEKQQIKPFAEVTARILKSLGGDCLAIARELEWASTEATQSESPQEGKNWAIAIGINRYRHLQGLRYAKADAETMAEWFEDAGFEQVFLFTDDSPNIPVNPPFPTSPTFENLDTFFDANFNRSLFKANDTLWFFFSGHGISENFLDYLILSDTNPRSLNKTALSVNSIATRLHNVGVGKIIMFLNIERRNTKTHDYNNGITIENYPNISIFFSCSPNEGVSELNSLGQSTFTYGLLEALFLTRGNITMEYLGQFLQNRISELYDQYRKSYYYTEKQTPQSLISPNLRDWIPFPSSLQVFDCQTPTVNRRGKIVKRDTRLVQFFREDLGNGVILEMVAILGGTFLMGSLEGEENRKRKVTVQPFFMAKYPITQAQWRSLASRKDLRCDRDLDPDPACFKDREDRDLRPVERINWYDAVEFCKRLSKLTGREYGLPSEAEWEYACRAWTTTPFAFGETLTDKLANYRANVTYADEAEGQHREETTPVGSFPPNGFGLYDMHGNVWEWCADDWHENYKDVPVDGSAWVENENDKKVNSSSILRGGSWLADPRDCRSAYRNLNIDGRGSIGNDGGCRVACGVKRV